MELDEEKTLHQVPVVSSQPKSIYQITPASLQRNQLGVFSHDEDSQVNDTSFSSSKSSQKKRDNPSLSLPSSKRLSPVRELIEELECFDEDMDVVMQPNNSMYVYGINGASTEELRAFHGDNREVLVITSNGQEGAV